MPRPLTLTDAIDLVRKCGLVEDRAVKEFVSRTKEDGFLGLTPEGLLARMVADDLLTPFQAEQLGEGRWRGLVLGDYHLQSRIGKGGMGQVFLAEDRARRRPVAIKVLNPDFADDPIAKARLVREAHATASLDHPNVVKVVAVDAAHSPPFLVMEFVDGLSLQAIVSRTGTLRVEAMALCGRQIANGLAHAADAGLVHRDIKPANVLLDRSGVVKILDLGIVLLRGETSRLTLDADGRCPILGTLDYLAPEQALDSHAVDGRADIYSLGGTLYFLLAGHPPFPEGDLHLFNARATEATPIHYLRPDVPEELSAVLATMLAYDPAQRYQTALEAAEALAPWAIPVAGFPEDLFTQLPAGDGTGEVLSLAGPGSITRRNGLAMNGSSVHAALSVTLSGVFAPADTRTPLLRPAPAELAASAVLTPAPQSQKTRPLPCLPVVGITAPTRSMSKPQVTPTPYKIAAVVVAVALLFGIVLALILRL